MKHSKGFFGRTNKTNDQKLIKKIKDLLNSPSYKPDKMTEAIVGYVLRYDKICSLTDKMRYHIKTHIELHFKEFP